MATLSSSSADRTHSSADAYSVIDSIAALEHLGDQLRSLIDPFIRFGRGKRITVLAGIAILAALRESALTLAQLKKQSKSGAMSPDAKLRASIAQLEELLMKLHSLMEPYIQYRRAKRLTAYAGDLLHMVLCDWKQTINAMKDQVNREA